MFRSRNKAATEKRKRKVLIWVISSLAGVVVLILTGYLWLMSWLQGDGFRQSMEEDLSRKLKADVSIPAPLQIDGSNIKLVSIGSTGTSYLKQAEVKGVEAVINRGKLWDRILHVEKIHVDALSVSISNKKEPEKSYPDDEESSFFSRFAPNTVIVDRVECDNAKVKLTFRRSDPKKKANVYSIDNSSFIATPINGQLDNWQIELRKGTFSTSHRFLAKSNITRARLGYSNDTITLDECQLELTKGNVDGTGSFNLKNKKWHVTLSAGNADIRNLLSKDYSEVLTGEFSGNLHMEGTRKEIHSANGHITLEKGEFKALSAISQFMSSKDRGDMALRIPGQEKASAYLEKTFEIVKIDSADCDIRYPHNATEHNIENAWLFDNIDIRTQNDKLRIAGHVIIEQDGKLHGTIRVGINKKIVEEFTALTTEPVRSLVSLIIPKLFNAPGDAAFYWVNINLSGTTDKPHQDLSARAKEIVASFNPIDTLSEAGSSILKTITGDGEQKQDTEKEPAQESSGRSLIETSTDTATDIIKTGADLIPFF